MSRFDATMLVLYKILRLVWCFVEFQVKLKHFWRIRCSFSSENLKKQGLDKPSQEDESKREPKQAIWKPLYQIWVEPRWLEHPGTYTWDQKLIKAILKAARPGRAIWRGRVKCSLTSSSFWSVAESKTKAQGIRSTRSSEMARVERSKISPSVRILMILLEHLMVARPGRAALLESSKMGGSSFSRFF